MLSGSGSLRAATRLREYLSEEEEGFSDTELEVFVVNIAQSVNQEDTEIFRRVLTEVLGRMFSVVETVDMAQTLTGASRPGGPGQEQRSES